MDGYLETHYWRHALQDGTHFDLTVFSNRTTTTGWRAMHASSIFLRLNQHNTTSGMSTHTNHTDISDPLLRVLPAWKLLGELYTPVSGPARLSCGTDSGYGELG
jgi:hypothetical protein